MLNKKGNVWAIIVVIGFFLIAIVGMIIFLIVIPNQQENNQEKQKELDIFIKSFSEGKQLSSNYILLDGNKNKITDGTTNKDSWEQTTIKENNNITYSCWKEGYYSTHNFKEFNKQELNNNASKINCNIEKAGDLEINHEGNLKQGENEITIELTSEKFKHTSFVASWTSGIISVELEDNSIPCKSEWKNYSKNIYSCNEELYECEQIENKRCIPFEQEIPERYKSGVDDVYYTGININDETKKIKLNIDSSSEISSRDYVELIFYDQDLIYEGNQIKLKNNVGIKKEFPYRIEYGS